MSRTFMRFALKRFLETGVTLFVIITLTFIMLHSLPGGPFDDDNALPAEIKSHIEHEYHLDKPLFSQYIFYVSGLFHGDLGESYKYLDRKVGDIIVESLPATFTLGFLTLILSYIVGIFLGVTAAAKRSKTWDVCVLVFANGGSSLPTFLVAPLLILVFSFWLDWLPPALWDGPRYYILPVVALAIRPIALITRLVRTSVLENIQSDPARTARAKGVSEQVVLFKHVLKNSLAPLIGISGSLVGHVLSGSFIVEQIFAVPGIARHFIEGVTNRDYPLILGLALFYSLLLIVANFLADVFYSLIDPRVKIT